MPRYVVIRESVEAPPQKERIAGQGGNLELDYQLPVKHVIMAAFFAFFKSGAFWVVLTIVAGILALVPVDLALRLLPLLLVPVPFGLVPAFRAADKEWTIFTGLVKQSRWAQEVALNRDLDGDGHVGRPQIIIDGAPAPPTKEDRDKAALAEFRAWILSLDTGGTAFRGNGIVRSEYERRRANLMRAGLAAWKDPRNHRAGWELLYPAEEIVERIK